MNTDVPLSLHGIAENIPEKIEISDNVSRDEFLADFLSSEN